MALLFWASRSNLDSDDYSKSIQFDNYDSTFTNDTLNIITYNIGYLSGMSNNRTFPDEEDVQGNLSNVLKQLNQKEPDIMVFQEIDFNSNRSYNIDQAHSIASNIFNHCSSVVNWDLSYLPFPYWPPKNHFGKVISGQAIMSDFSITKNDRIPLCRNEKLPFWKDMFYLDRIAQIGEVVVGDKKVYVINVHLDAFDKETRCKQHEEILEIYNKYAAAFPTILIGDFNSDPNRSEACIERLLQQKNMSCAHDLLKSKFTFPADNPQLLLDHIFYNPEYIKVIDYAVLNNFNTSSDHLPVSMDFILLD